MPEAWSRVENEATVATYFAMLRQELAKESYNKAALNRVLEEQLNDRSRQAIEFKHANISAVMIELGYPYVDGYKPRGNYQDLLRDMIVERLTEDGALAEVAAAAVEAPASELPPVVAWNDIIVPAPKPDQQRPSRERSGAPAIRQVNYLEREARNASLGAAGEEFVVQLEHDRLQREGAQRLADRIERVSKTRGDGLGYDILSFEASGRERLIEVKTTRYGAMTPFFATPNEVDLSVTRAADYHLYRVFKFDEAAKVFVLPGSLRTSVDLATALYRASLR